MRLIDVDKIIKENEDEIQRLSKKIERLESGGADIDPYYADRKIKQYQRDITDYKIENRILKRYEIAYDVDKVVEKLKKVSYERYGNDGMGGEPVVNLDDAIEIVKRGGRDD